LRRRERERVRASERERKRESEKDRERERERTREFDRAIPSYQKRPSSSSLRKREGNVRFPTNLHGVRRSARPTSW